MSLRTLSLFILLFIPPTLSQANNTLPNSESESIILAGGCFWCLEADYEKLNGVIDAVSGYSGGHIKNPRYAQVSSGSSGHIEVVKITYDPRLITYAEILDYFWLHIDPTYDDRQFCDKGPQYRPAIFYKNQTQKLAILESARRIEKIKKFKEPLKVEYIKQQTFYVAEDYHQDYYKKNPLRYKYYRFSCGRDARVESLWGTTEH